MRSSLTHDSDGNPPNTWVRKDRKGKTGKRENMSSAIFTQELMNLYDAFLSKSLN